MSGELIWRTSVAASAMHASHLVAHGHLLANPRLAEAVRRPTERLQGEIALLELAEADLWAHLICSADENTTARQRVGEALRAAGLPADQVDRRAGPLAECVAEIESVHARTFPDLSRELQLRCGPLRELWEGRGPGLLRALGKFTQGELLVDRATVILLQPALGGGGRALPACRSVLIEAVLTNPMAELPEVARLGWLLAQLGRDARGDEPSGTTRHAARICELACLPATLEAAQYVELARFDADTLAQALAVWPTDPPDATSNASTTVPSSPAVTGTVSETNLPDQLLTWWRTYRDNRPPWNEALRALEQSLRNEEPRISAAKHRY